MIRTKLLLSIILLCVSFGIANAQQYGNEWINYAQSYYKFAVSKDSVYRVPISQLTAAGMPTTVQGANLQLFRDGVEVPIYVSQNGVLSSTDFIDFYGEKAKGNIDTRLYKNAALQLNPNLNFNI
jgi:hypothetical protein